MNATRLRLEFRDFIGDIVRFVASSHAFWIAVVFVYGVIATAPGNLLHP